MIVDDCEDIVEFEGALGVSSWAERRVEGDRGVEGRRSADRSA